MTRRYQFTDVSAVRRLAQDARETLKTAFGPDTAYDATEYSRSVAAGGSVTKGHSYSVAVVAWAQFDCDIVSGMAHGERHAWFRAYVRGNKAFDVDLTGDQFGLPEVQVVEAGRLYVGRATVRGIEAIRPPLLRRAERLAMRAGLTYAAGRIAERLAALQPAAIDLRPRPVTA
jgi:hypothetical protein